MQCTCTWRERGRVSRWSRFLPCDEVLCSLDLQISEGDRHRWRSLQREIVTSIRFLFFYWCMASPWLQFLSLLVLLECALHCWNGWIWWDGSLFGLLTLLRRWLLSWRLQFFCSFSLVVSWSRLYGATLPMWWSLLAAFSCCRCWYKMWPDQDSVLLFCTVLHSSEQCRDFSVVQRSELCCSSLMFKGQSNDVLLCFPIFRAIMLISDGQRSEQCCTCLMYNGQGNFALLCCTTVRAILPYFVVQL